MTERAWLAVLMLTAGCQSGERVSAEEAQRRAERNARVYTEDLVSAASAEREAERQKAEREQAAKDRVLFKVISDIRRPRSGEGQMIEVPGRVVRVELRGNTTPRVTLTPSTEASPELACILAAGVSVPRVGDLVELRGRVHDGELTGCAPASTP